jgi:hypothetical protein
MTQGNLVYDFHLLKSNGTHVMCQEDKSNDMRVAGNMRRTSVEVEEWTEVRGPRIEAVCHIKLMQIVYYNYAAVTVVLVGTHCNCKLNITHVSNKSTLIDIDSAEVSC